MSVVTNVVLAIDLEDDSDGEHVPPSLQALTGWCERDGYGFLGLPRSVDAVSGGGKRLECGLYAWAINHLRLDEFLDVVANIRWEEPTSVQLFIKGEDDDRFRMYTLRRDRTWHVLGDAHDVE